MFLISGLLERFRRDPLADGAAILGRIEAAGSVNRGLDDNGLRKASLALRYRLLSGEPADRVLPEAFALVREASRRTLGMTHYDVQLLGGLAMHRRGIAVMQTGEGKTLTATLPLYLAALAGKGAHLATANDYLASRDARQMTPLFALLGLTTAAVVSATLRPDRHSGWRCDVTYTTAKEIGFDFLRDRLLNRQRESGVQPVRRFDPSAGNGSHWDEPVLRELHFVLVDEADSILIDEARTPLIISSDDGHATATRLALFQWANAALPLLAATDTEIDHARRRATLTERGRRTVRELPTSGDLATTPLLELYEQVELALGVQLFYQRDRHYVVREDEVVIVDEFTGRLAEGRRWRSGVHQAIEVREGLDPSADTGESARATLQDLFLRYERMAGMTGTVASSARELELIYKVRVCPIPTHRPPRRRELPAQVFLTNELKLAAIVDEVAAVCATSQPVLIGTRSIDKSETLSARLTARGIPHQVLNARNHEQEAALVAAAGRAGSVTVATNMAGRGTDIQPDAEALKRGGLHVIGTELHDSERIDRQLTGRCGRQGDPGSWRVLLSLDDDILRQGLGEKYHAALLRRAQGSDAKSRSPRSNLGSDPLLVPRYRSLDHLITEFRRAQRTIETRHFQARKLLVHEEQQLHQQQIELGLDPWLDAPSH